MKKDDKTICNICNDTHMMWAEDRDVMCTYCPIPCQVCRLDGIGAFCATTPCACSCHIDALKIIDNRFFNTPEAKALLAKTEENEAEFRKGYDQGYEEGMATCAEYYGLDVKKALKALRLDK